MRPDDDGSLGALLRSPTAGLAVAILLLEFCSASQVFVNEILAPVVVAHFNAVGDYSVVVAAGSVGTFAALPLTARLLARFGARRVLAGSLIGYLAGAIAAATAAGVWVYAGGRLVQGVATGILAVFGLSTVIDSFSVGHRVRLLSLTSSMWVLPALLCPPATVLAEQSLGWRWTSLLLLPIIFAARVLLGRHLPGTPAARTSQAAQPRGWAVLALPGGMALFVGGAATPLRAWSLFGLAIALLGAHRLLPAGTFTARAGQPRAVLLLGLLAVSYFGGDALLSSLLTRGYHLALGWSAEALSAAAIAWSVASLAQPRLIGSRRQHTTSVTATGLSVVAASCLAIGCAPPLAFGHMGVVSVACWGFAGIGVGIAYPSLYFAGTTAPTGQTLDSGQLSTAVILSESLGAVVGTALGTTTVTTAIAWHHSERHGLQAAFILFAAAGVLAAVLSRTGRAPAR